MILVRVTLKLKSSGAKHCAHFFIMNINLKSKSFELKSARSSPNCKRHVYLISSRTRLKLGQNLPCTHQYYLSQRPMSRKRSIFNLWIWLLFKTEVPNFTRHWLPHKPNSRLLLWINVVWIARHREEMERDNRIKIRAESRRQWTQKALITRAINYTHIWVLCSDGCLNPTRPTHRGW